jgi:hypothetical protein
MIKIGEHESIMNQEIEKIEAEFEGSIERQRKDTKKA